MGFTQTEMRYGGPVGPCPSDNKPATYIILWRVSEFKIEFFYKNQITLEFNFPKTF